MLRDLDRRGGSRLIGWCITIGVLVFSRPLAQADEPVPVLTYGEAIRTALSRNETASLADEDVRRAKLLRQRAWAALLPQLNVIGYYTYTSFEVAFDNVVLQHQHALSGGAGASMNLLKAPAIWGIGQAGQTAAAAEQRRRWTRWQLAFEVASAYYAALAMESSCAAARRSLETAEEGHAVVKAHEDVGKALAVDETRARLQVVSAREQVTRLENSLKDSVDYLAFLTYFRPPFHLVDPPDVRLPALPLDASEDLTQLSRRPDLAALRHQVLAARKSLTQAWLDYLPTLDVTGALLATENMGFVQKPVTWNIVLALKWILYDGGLREAEKADRQSQLESRILEWRQALRRSQVELQRTIRAVTTAEAILQTALEQVQLARETRALVLSKYRVGRALLIELVEAESKLDVTEQTLVQQKLSRQLRLLDLLKLVGYSPEGTRQS